jgi:hypothetical protein
VFADKLRDLGAWRCDEAAHEEIAAMHFQNHRRIRANRGRIIGDRGFVGRTDFAELSSVASRISPMRKPPPIARAHRAK